MNDDLSKPLHLIWGAEGIGNEIGRNTRQTFHMLEKGLIRGARKIGGRWVAEQGNLRETFVGKPGE